MSSLGDLDPLDVLLGEDPPVQPDASFALRLRRRLEAAADFSSPTRTEPKELS